MAGRKCAVCVSPRRAEAEKAIRDGDSKADVGRIAGCSIQAVSRHLAHAKAEVRAAAAVPELVRRAPGADPEEKLAGLMTEAERLLDAVREWLADPQDPRKFSLAPRGTEVQVVYETLNADGKVTLRRDELQELIRRIEEHAAGCDTVGGRVVTVRYRSTDPRRLLLQTVGRLQELIESGHKLQRERERDRHVRLEDALRSEMWRSFLGGLLELLARRAPDVRAEVVEVLRLAQGGGADA